MPGFVNLFQPVFGRCALMRNLKEGKREENVGNQAER